MALSWLHVSDFHIRSGDSYDRDVVLHALVASVSRLREAGHAPDLIFATGDVANSGKAAEYDLATTFFDDLLEAARLERRNLFVIPGNHDVDRDLGVGLARTLSSPEESDAYFAPGAPKPHLTQKLGAFRVWYDGFFEGIRSKPETTCGPVELVEVDDERIGILPVNSALFCQDDSDHAQLWIGRRAVDSAVAELSGLEPDVRIALVHHPFEWLADAERGNIRAVFAANVDFVLRGHLHETDVEQVVSPHGATVNLAAGAAYQTRRWPNRALYATWDGASVKVYPVRYEDSPTEVWTTDPSVFPDAPDHTGRIEVRGADAHVSDRYDSVPAPSPTTRFRSNVPSRRGLPIIGRESELETLAVAFAGVSEDAVLVVTGAPGVGKSELAREHARRHRDRYPGGTFLIDATSAGVLLDLVRVGVNHVGLTVSSKLGLEDQCEQALAFLGTSSTLLIYDNVNSFEAIERWLPPAGMPCHVVITSVREPVGPGWATLRVDPLTPHDSVQLINALAGRHVAETYGQTLAAQSGGLPVQLCPAAATVAYEDRRGRGLERLAPVTEEARESFALVYEHLDTPARLLLHAAAGLNPQRIERDELLRHMEVGAQWSAAEVDRCIDVCADLHLLQGDVELRMHQLFGSFLNSLNLAEALARPLGDIREAQRERLIEIARELSANPADAALAAGLTGFHLAPAAWSGGAAPLAIPERHDVGAALLLTGEFEVARAWYESTLAALREGDEEGRIDHALLAHALHQIGFSHSNMGEFKRAREFYEGAAEETGKWEVDGRVDGDRLGRHLHQIGLSHSEQRNFAEARVWYEQAVEAKRRGDIDGRVDHPSLGFSLHSIGVTYSREGDFAQARVWHEEAVEEARRGDANGLVNHEVIGRGLHEVGYCHSSQGQFEEARIWYERAAEEKRLGDIGGRIDHQSLATSLHQLGYCHACDGDLEQARTWYEQAVEDARRGDVHGRIDHQALGESLHDLARCYSEQSGFAEARAWHVQAVDEARQGDVHGRVNRESLSIILLAAAGCLRALGETGLAIDWEDEARSLTAEKEHAPRTS